MTQEGADSYGGNVAYSADTYGVSVTYAMVEDASGVDDTYTALNAFWTPDGFPSISAGYEFGSAQGLRDTTQWFVGLQWDEMGPGVLGAAVGSAGAFATNEEVMYEAYYSYPVNDSVSQELASPITLIV